MTLKIALAGTGSVARKQYLPYLAKVQDVTLGYHNRTTKTAHEVAEQFGGEVFESLEDLTAWMPDSVLVLTAETVRDEVATALIELGVPRLFFEKPLVAREGQAHVTENDFERGRSMLKSAAERGIETAMVFNYRFFDHTVRAKRLIEERDLGRPVGVHGTVHYACWSHCIDLMLFLAGDVVTVSATGGAEHRSFWDAVEVAASFQLASGGAGVLLGTSATSLAHPLYDLTFHYERGSIRLVDLDGPLELITGDEGLTERFNLGYPSSRGPLYDRSFQRSLAAYLETLRAGTPPPIPGLAGLQELQFEAAIRRSIAEGRAVDMKKEFAI